MGAADRAEASSLARSAVAVVVRDRRRLDYRLISPESVHLIISRPQPDGRTNGVLELNTGAQAEELAALVGFRHRQDLFLLDL